MNAWKIGLFLGLIWGLISATLGFTIMLATFIQSSTISATKIILAVLFLPSYIAMLVKDQLLDFRIFFALPLAIGALMGTGIGWLIDRYNSRAATLWKDF